MSATTQVKGLSLEIFHITLGQGFHFSETNITATVSGEVVVAVSGSETVAGISYVFNGTWESHRTLNGSRIHSLGSRVLHEQSCKASKGAEEATRMYNIMAVGLVRSKGVNRVMSIESVRRALEGASGLTQRERNSLAIP
jgi:hypothetical protein